MPTTITCACGRPLLLREEHAGKEVRCPSCGRQFTAPAPDAVVPTAVPADRGDTYNLVPEEKPPPPPAVRPYLRRRSPAEGRPRRTPLPHLGLGFVWRCLDHRFVYRITWLVLLVGAMFVFYSFLELRLALVTSDTPQRLTLAQLAAHGPGDNAHVVLTDCALCDGYVCLVKVGRFDRLIAGTDPTKKRWEGVFVPVVPLTPELRQRRARGEAAVRENAPADLRVLLLSYTVHGEADLDRLGAQAELQGTVVNSIKSLDGKTASLLRELYPGTDFSNCLIFQEGRRPSPSTTSLLFVFLGTCLAVGSGVLLLVRHLYRPPEC
jgi:hypothetical protein